jgi:replicative DNA helicase
MKMAEHAWKMNKRVGFIEPEMTASKTGYRFDTLHAHIPNSALMRGEELDNYEEYITELKSHSVPFFVAHPKDFKRKITVSKLRSFVETNQIDLLVIDGISYLTDERKERGDSRTIQLTNISEDLMDLSIEMKIPVIVVCQSNREGVKDNEPELENIRDSDGIAYNASLVFSVFQCDPGIQITIKKNRNGENNKKFKYAWDINNGVFEFRNDSDDENFNPDSHTRRDAVYDDGAF